MISMVLMYRRYLAQECMMADGHTRSARPPHLLAVVVRMRGVRVDKAAGAGCTHPYRPQRNSEPAPLLPRAQSALLWWQQQQNWRADPQAQDWLTPARGLLHGGEQAEAGAVVGRGPG
jgi:hypothetical protein